MRAAPRIMKIMPKPKRKSDPKRNAQHLDFVRSLPCCVCGRAPRSDAAHIRVGTDGGVAVRPSDRFCVPLCRTAGTWEGCHNKQHRVGEQTFWGTTSIDPMVVAARLWAVSGDAEQGLRVVLRAHQTARLRNA